MPIWDAHCHPDAPGADPAQRLANHLQYADRMGIERLCIFMGRPWSVHPTPDLLRRTNDDILAMVRAHPDRVFGFVYLSAEHVDASLAEFERCVVNGPLVGVKFWQSAKADAPEMEPLIARAKAMRAVVLHDSYLYGYERPIPSSSGPDDIVRLSRRHPGFPLICAHTGGAGWELGIRQLQGVPDVYAEISGSEPQAGFVEMAVRELGARRVIYGSDSFGRSFATQLGKVRDAEISDADKQLILRDNLRRLLLPILTTKGIKA